MKKLLFIFICASVSFMTQAQVKISSSQWKSDLTFLQNKIHSNYAHLFHNITPAQFDSAVHVLKKDISSLSETEIKVRIIQLIAMFKIGHTHVRFESGENNDDLSPMFHFYPFRISLFTDGLYIQQIDTLYKTAIGGKLVKIGDCPVDDVLQKMHSVIPCENEQFFKSNLHYYLRFPEILQALKITADANNVELTYLKEGSKKKIKIAARNCPGYEWNDGPFLPNGWEDAYVDFNTPKSTLWLKEPHKIRYFEYLKESKTVYVRHTAVTEREDEIINEFFEKAFQFADSVNAEKFILDIRMNGGGNNYLNKSVITGIIKSKSINRYGHLFVIIGAATFSAAQNLTNELEKYSEAIFVGEPTAENVNFWGDYKTEVLPSSKLNIHLSWLWWQNMDPRDNRQWTAPNLATDMSFEDYKAGIDPSMNIVLNYQNYEPIEETIKNYIAAGNNEEAVAAGKKYLENPLYRYCKDELEEKISDLGAVLTLRGKFDEGINYFYVAIKVFPNSSNAYSNYGDCLSYMGNNEEAFKNYEIAISLTHSKTEINRLKEKIATIAK